MVTYAPPHVVQRLRAQGRSPAQDNSPRGDMFDPNCATRLMLHRIGEKWTALVVLLLSDGPMRFSEVRARLGPVAPKVLTQTLRRIERDGLVTRTIFAEVPPRTEYELTDLGRSLTAAIGAIGDWAESHLGQVAACQTAYDAAHESSRPKP